MLGIVLGSIALGIALFALVVSVAVARRAGTRDPLAVPAWLRKGLRVKATPHTSTSRFAATDTEKMRVAFIANPTKDNVQELHERALRACSIRYLPQPMWFHTTMEDPGFGQATDAIAAGADVVVAVGGDGTVRAVAEACIGADVAMGILPAGTGNLLARNLELPIGDVGGLLRAILDGEDKAIDVGYMDLELGAANVPVGKRYLFLVMAGAGMDAEMVASANPNLKRRFGWLAYFFAALRHLGDKRVTVALEIDGGEAVSNEMRTVLMANSGRLPGGLQLIPNASLTDGKLNIASLDARAGIVGWTDLFGTVVAQGAGIKQSELLKAWRVSRIDHAQGERVTITMASPLRVQIDGEVLGRARKFSAFIKPKALRMRVPAQS